MASYDRAITVFSPDGQLLQVQYAQEAARRGSAAVGIRGGNCIVIAVEKKSVGELQDARSEKKIVALDSHVMMAFAGWKADARILISRSILPEEQLLQVQYAQEAARRGSAAVGIQGGNCIVIALEKSVGELQDARLEKKIVALDSHVMMAFAGWKADARILISRSQIECQSYRLTVEDPVSIEYITKYIAEMKQKYTQSNGRRPFGISCLIGGYDYDGQPHLFQTEPSGIYFEWKASSIGRCEKSVREFLEQKYTPELVATEKGAVKLAIKAFLEVIQSGQKNIQVAVMTNGKPMRLLEDDLVTSISAEIAQEKAKAEADKKK